VALWELCRSKEFWTMNCGPVYSLGTVPGENSFCRILHYRTFRKSYIISVLIHPNLLQHVRNLGNSKKSFWQLTACGNFDRQRNMSVCGPKRRTNRPIFCVVFSSFWLPAQRIQWWRTYSRFPRTLCRHTCGAVSDHVKVHACIAWLSSSVGRF